MKILLKKFTASDHRTKENDREQKYVIDNYRHAEIILKNTDFSASKS